jgi:hypothetical protein
VIDNIESGQVLLIALRYLLSVFISSKLRNTILLLFNKCTTSYAVNRCDFLLTLLCRFPLLFVTCVFCLQFCAASVIGIVVVVPA